MRMRTILHILTRPDDLLSQTVIAGQTSESGVQIEVADLTRGEPDYAALLLQIFSADSVQVW
jgi:hypothetical protein